MREREKANGRREVMGTRGRGREEERARERREKVARVDGTVHGCEGRQIRRG